MLHLFLQLAVLTALPSDSATRVIRRECPPSSASFATATQISPAVTGLPIRGSGTSHGCPAAPGLEVLQPFFGSAHLRKPQLRAGTDVFERPEGTINAIGTVDTKTRALVVRYSAEICEEPLDPNEKPVVESNTIRTRGRTEDRLPEGV